MMNRGEREDMKRRTDEEQENHPIITFHFLEGIPTSFFFMNLKVIFLLLLLLLLMMIIMMTAADQPFINVCVILKKTFLFLWSSPSFRSTHKNMRMTMIRWGDLRHTSERQQDRRRLYITSWIKEERSHQEETRGVWWWWLKMIRNDKRLFREMRWWWEPKRRRKKEEEGEGWG